jgi:hypothetical protein
MGIDVGETPGTILSRVSTAPNSVEGRVQEEEEQVEVVRQEDPPENIEEEEVMRGLDPDQDEGFDNNNDEFDNNNDEFDNEQEEDAKSMQLSAKSSSKTPDMENSMEEMVEKYNDEYEDDEEGRGFELNTQEEGGFENNYDDFEEVSWWIVVGLGFVLLIVVALNVMFYIFDYRNSRWHLRNPKAKAVMMRTRRRLVLPYLLFVVYNYMTQSY